jgi:hypothetical protein
VLAKAMGHPILLLVMVVEESESKPEHKQARSPAGDSCRFDALKEMDGLFIVRTI